jgi:3-hydroxyisobutyrate dehydrogenase
MRIAFIGTGLMGAPMAERVIALGYSLIVYNRTREKLEKLRSLGAEVADSPAKAIAESDCTILMLSDARAIDETLLSPESGPALAGHTIIQMGTISPSQSIHIRDTVNSAGGDYLEAPVLGSIPEAVSGKLIVMVGATKEQYERQLHLLKCFGPNPLRVGGVGQAAALKLALNQLIGSLTASFCLSLGFIERNGIDPDIFMEILRKSSLYAPTFDKKLNRFLERDYSKPNFPAKHLAKDLGLILEEAKKADLDTSGLAGIYQILEKAQNAGFSDTDYSAIFEVICPKER